MTINFSGNLVIGSKTWLPKAQLKFNTPSLGNNTETKSSIIVWDGESVDPIYHETNSL